MYTLDYSKYFPQVQIIKKPFVLRHQNFNENQRIGKFHNTAVCCFIAVMRTFPITNTISISGKILLLGPNVCITSKAWFLTL